MRETLPARRVPITVDHDAAPADLDALARLLLALAGRHDEAAARVRENEDASA